MIKIELSLATLDDALAAMARLAGVAAAVSMSDAVTGEPTTPPKKATPKAKAEAATKEAFEEEKPAKKSAKKAVKAAPTVDELRAHILSVAPEGPEQPTLVKEYVRSFGTNKVSDLTEAQRQEAFDGAADYFASQSDEEDEEGAEEDPMA